MIDRFDSNYFHVFSCAFAKGSILTCLLQFGLGVGEIDTESELPVHLSGRTYFLAEASSRKREKEKMNV